MARRVQTDPVAPEHPMPERLEVRRRDPEPATRCQQAVDVPQLLDGIVQVLDCVAHRYGVERALALEVAKRPLVDGYAGGASRGHGGRVGLDPLGVPAQAPRLADEGA